jgi:hypothetical protein
VAKPIEAKLRGIKPKEIEKKVFILLNITFLSTAKTFFFKSEFPFLDGELD